MNYKDITSVYNTTRKYKFEEQIEVLYNSRHTEWVKQIIIIKDDKLLKVYQRK